MLFLRLALPVTVLVLAATAAAAGHGARALSECATLADRRLEVCTAYVANASLGARLPYYKLGRSENAARARLARYRLESRYVGAARIRIERQVSRWPAGARDVDLPRISIVSVSVAGDRAMLVTRETWRVETPAGRVLFAEARGRHVTTMRKTAGLLLHKWVVIAFR